VSSIRIVNIFILALIAGLYAFPFPTRGDLIDEVLKSTVGSKRQAALVAARKGNYDEALKLIADALEKSRNAPDILCDQILIFYMADKPLNALESYRKLPPKYKAPAYLEPVLAKCLYKSEDWNQALPAIEACLAKNPQDKDLSELQLKTCIAMGNYDKALLLSAEMAKIFPGETWLQEAKVRAKHMKAVAVSRDGKFAEADALLSEAFEESGRKDLSIVFDRVVVFSWAGKHAEAVKLFEAIPPGTLIPDYVLPEIAKSCLLTGDKEKAASFCREALARNPQNEAAIALLAKASATADSRKKEEPAPSKQVPAENSTRDQAVSLGREGKYEEADKLFLKALEEKPGDAATLCDRITVLSWAGKHKEAIRLFESLPASFKPPEYMMAEIARSYRENSEHEKALSAYSGILAKDDARKDAALAILALLTAEDEGKAREFLAHRIATHPEEKASLQKTFAIALKNHAVQEARSGRTKDALALIKEALAESGGDARVLADYIVLLSWGGLHKEAIEAFAQIPQGYDCPEYLLEAVARSQRELGDFEKAEALYQKILDKNPENSNAGFGLMISKIKLRKTDEALQYLEKSRRLLGKNSAGIESLWGDVCFESGNLQEARKQYEKALSLEADNVQALIGMSKLMLKEKKYLEAQRFAKSALAKGSSNIEALYCLAEALEGSDDFMGAYQVYDRITQLPGGRPAIDAKYRILSELGANGLALEKMKKDSERPADSICEEINGNAAAARIARLEPKTAERILDLNIAHAAAAGSGDFMRRSRYDKFIADRQMEKMLQIISDYEALLKTGETPPYWVTETAADANLYLRRPKQALELYQKAKAERAALGLDAYPDNFELNMSIYFTLVELERFDDAGKILDEIESPVRTDRVQRGIYLKNWDYASLAVERGWWLIFQNKLAEAEVYFDDLLARASYNTNIRTAQAYLHYYRGWPRKALEDFQIVCNTDPNDKAGQVGLCYTMDENDEGEEARTRAKELLKKNPTDLAVQKLNRSFEIDDMRTETIKFDYSQEQNEADGFTLSQRLDQPIYPHRSVYLETLWKHVMKGGIDDDNIPNSKEIFRTAVGVDWRICRDLTLTGAGSVDYQGKHPGGEGGFIYTPDDHWTIRGNYTSYSLNAPSWILLDDGYAQEYNTSVKYRLDENFNAELGFGQMFISDHNITSTWSARQDKVFYNDAVWRLGLALEEEFSMNSKTDVNYYSPQYNLYVYSVPYAEHLWYRRYDFSITDRLFLGPGMQFEKDYSAKFAGYIRYEQEWQLTDSCSFVAGITGTRKNYDGEGSYGFGISTMLVFHF